jgi:hypothetical protein
MSGNKRHNRNARDQNERALIELAASLGAQWFEEGPLDGWIFIPRMGARYMPVEIKIPEREGLRHEFTPMQRRFIARCELLNAPYWVWRTSADVLRDLNG